MADSDKLDALVQQAQAHVKTLDNTLMSFVIDRSGSMTGTAAQVIEGFNKLIMDQRNEPGKARVSLTLFDTDVTVVYTGKPIEDVPELSAHTYRPDGFTALLDAQAITIRGTEDYLDSLPESERPGTVIFITMTDGGENASKEYRGAAGAQTLKKLIEDKETKSGWDFAYTGANQDAVSVGSGMGYAAGATRTYAGTPAGTTQTFDTMSSSVSGVRSQGARKLADDGTYVSRDSNFWEPEDK